mmetsp:Transcript_40696/g.110004  ORF Transcript_40696/g.110004 Transcript_40696/m.110004 type:complete len:370 (-) Transcript_40696:247-1356(-)
MVFPDSTASPAIPSPMRVRWGFRGPSMTSVYSCAFLRSSNMRAVASAPRTFLIPSSAGMYRIVIRCEAPEVFHSGDPVMLIDRSQFSMTSSKVFLLSAEATEMCEQMAERMSSSLCVKDPVTFLLNTTMTPCTRPERNIGMQRMLCTLIPLPRRLSWYRGSYKGSSWISAMFTNCPVVATWPMKPTSLGHLKFGKLGEWCAENRFSRSPSKRSNATASACRILPTLMITDSNTSSRSFSRRSLSACFGSIQRSGQQPRMQPRTIPMHWPVYCHALVTDSWRCSLSRAGSSKPIRTASCSTAPPEKMPATSLKVLPTAAAAIVLKLTITQRVVSMNSPIKIIRKLSRKPKPTKGKADDMNNIRNCVRLGG